MEKTMPTEELSGSQNVLVNNQKDHFNLEKLRLSQNFAEMTGVRKALLTVPVRKPPRQDFIRVHPGSEWYLETAILEFREENESYVVESSLWHELPGEIVPKVLYVTINRQGVVAVWPIRLPGEDGRIDEWNRSALQAAEIAQRRWIRVASNRSLGAYEVYEAVGNIPDPDWPDSSFQEILEIAFKDRLVSDMDHPAIKRLRGEI